jgi:P-type Ca2+ transporter type 2C
VRQLALFFHANQVVVFLTLNDLFCSLHRWGRNVLNCVRKFLQFQLAVNLTAIAVTFIGSLTTGESPLSAVQLLWVNLIMDTLGALALASDEPDDDILLKAPHGRHEKMITRPMTQYIVAQTIFQVAALLIVLYTGDLFIPMDTTRYTTDALRAQRIETLVFTCFVFLQISNEVMARNLNHQLNMFKGVFRNPLFAMILVLILIVQCCMVQFAQAFAGTVALVWPEWIACALVGLANFVWMFFVRLGVKVYRRHIAIRNHRIHVAGSLKELESGTIGAGGGKEHVMKSSI